jgi:hypothetical protein
MLHSKASKFAIFAAVSLLSVGIVSSAHAISATEWATEWSGGSVIKLGYGVAYAINASAQVVGVNNGGYAVEWSGGGVIQLGKAILAILALAFPTPSTLPDRWWGWGVQRPGHRVERRQGH